MTFFYKRGNGEIFFSGELYIGRKVIASKQPIRKNINCCTEKERGQREMIEDNGRIVEKEGVGSK